MKAFALAVLIIAVVLPTFLYFASPLDPIKWRPDPISSLSGTLERNNRLDMVQFIGEQSLFRPEDISIGSDGFIYTGLRDGRVVKVHPDRPNQLIQITDTGGRPLGTTPLENGKIIVSDAMLGLLCISENGDMKVLANEFENEKLLLTLDNVVASNGDIFFAVAAQGIEEHEYVRAFIEAKPTGRIFRYRPSTKALTLVLDKLFFSNGLILSPTEDYLLISEGGRGRILKHHIKGDNAGKTEVFVDALPGVPSDISFNGDEQVWVSFMSLRDWRIEKLAAYPKIRRILGALPAGAISSTQAYGLVLGYDLTGRLSHNLQTPDAITHITSAVEHQGQLYMSSLEQGRIAVYQLER